VCAVRQIEAAWVFSPSRDHAQSFAIEMGREPWAPSSIHVAESPAEDTRRRCRKWTAQPSPGRGWWWIRGRLLWRRPAT
jgi:hypothetical protein